MKKSLLIILISLIGFALSPQKSNAQVLPGINILHAGDTLWSWPAPCSVPDTVQTFMYGTAGGYLPTDSVTLHISFGDGSDTTFLSPIMQSYFWVNLNHIYTLPGIYSLLFIATGPDGSADTVLQNNTVIVANQCGNIAGNVFLDGNSDCTYNMGDVELQWYQVRLWYNGSVLQTAYTDANGDYYFNVPTGFTYTLDVINPNMNVTTLCPSGGSYTITTLPALNQNFAINCAQPGFDLTGEMHGWGVRPNVQATFYFGFWNLGCQNTSGTVTFTLPAGLTFVSSVPAPANVSGQVITYNVSSFNFYGLNPYSYDHMVVAGSGSLVIGDTVCVDMVIDPQTGDLNMSNNIIQCCVPVRNSCDPNEKSEVHAGFNTANVLPLTQLDYTIFFQNVGNDVAYNISVVDTLDADLLVNSLNVVSASHPMVIYTKDNIVKFEFSNINLAAASVNEPLSHGFIHYKIWPKPNLAQGTSIQNKAHIYFDFNGAINTNTVTDIIDLTLGVQDIQPLVFTFGPNPANESITIHTGSEKPVECFIYNAQGSIVLNKLVQNNEIVPLSEFASGIYSVAITSENVQYKNRLIIIK